MSYFTYQNQTLHAEQLALPALIADYATPLFVYSATALREAYQSYAQAFAAQDTLICFAMKANSNLSILRLFAEQGAGFDIVSGGELARALAAGANPQKIVFSGVGKNAEEIRAALAANILCFNVESVPELTRINRIAGEMGKIAPISLRVNPNVDAQTHPYISTGLKENKFGIAYEEALSVYQQAANLPHLAIHGIDCHIGSQITDVSPFLDALDKILVLVDALTAAGIHLQHIDMGGGIGICYSEETPPNLQDYAALLHAKLGNRQLKLLLEPGRSLVGNAGILITQVEYLKHQPAKNFAIVDAAMNDLMRPALYEAWHSILPVQEHSTVVAQEYDIVGPICESGDFLARSRALSLSEGDCIALLSAGAYGMSMSSNYNTRPRAAEVLVDGATVKLIKARETLADLLSNEINCL